MLTIIVNSGNFQPRVMTLPKDDFPIESYNLLLENSKSSPENPNRHVLLENIVWKGRMGSAEKNSWNHITNEIYKIVDWWHDPNMRKPEWCKNAKVDRDHGFFNSKCIVKNHETFEVIEQELVYENEDEELVYAPKQTLYDTISEMLEHEYSIKK